MKQVGPLRIQCVVIVICLLYSLCAGEEAFSQERDERGAENRITVCIPSPILTLDPTAYRDRTTQMVIKNLFDALTTRNEEMQVVPQLAESWKAVSDTIWEFKLKRGVKFHNGDELTAKDVNFTFERVIREGGMDGTTSPRKSLLGPLDSVKVIDDYTVQLVTKRPWAILPLMLTLQEIVPMKYMNDVGSDAFRQRPIGCGPFRFEKRDDNGDLFLRRFEDYYGGSEDNPPVRPPAFEHLVFKTVPEYIERLAMLKRGMCDIVTQIPPESVGILGMVPDVDARSRPATRSYFAEINCGKLPFKDRHVRLALNYAVDMQAVVEHTLRGYGTVLPTILLPNAFAYDDSLQPYNYQPGLAEKLLNEAGLPKGTSITIYYTQETMQFANAIAVFLGKVGLKCVLHRIKSQNIGELLRSTTGWDIYATSWGNSTLDPVGILVPKLLSNGRGNFSGYRNREVDTLLEAADNTLDLRRRKACYTQIQKIIYRDVPMIFGYAPEEIFGISRRVRNFVPSSSGMMNMHDVYLKQGD